MSQWADKERRLSPDASALPGEWSTDAAPFQREIMDAFNEPKVSASYKRTHTIVVIVGYSIDKDPAPILVVQPTLDMAETWSKDRLVPMLRDSPTLRGKVTQSKRDGENTIRHKKFSGGHLTVSGANSPSSLASRPIRFVLLDEVDNYPVSAGVKGDPANLAVKRATTFHNKKV